MDDSLAACVVDIGTGLARAGIAGEDAPRVVFPTIVEHDHSACAATLLTAAQERNGDRVDVICTAGSVTLGCPMNCGMVDNWEDMERVWHYVFYDELQIAPEERPVMLTEIAQNPKRNRERTTEIMFETFRVPSMFLAIQQVLALYAAGRTTGIVLDCGEGVAYAVPVYEGFHLPMAVLRTDCAGMKASEYLRRMLVDRGCRPDALSDRVVRDIKERLAYVALDYEEELKAAQANPASIERSYELPDGQVVTLGSERFQCGECLFTPQLINYDVAGVPWMVKRTILSVDVDIRKDLYANIVLAGGTSMMTGFAERVQNDVTRDAPPAVSAKIITMPDRAYAAWCGGSIQASLSTFREKWVTRNEYEEGGPPVVHRKCY